MTKRLIEAAAILALLVPPAASIGSQPAAAAQTPSEEARRVRDLALERGFAPLPPPPEVRPVLVELGRALAFDPILSGNRDISCMTCHHPALGTGDGLRLSIGAGGVGVGPSRRQAAGLTIGRNSPPLYNLHATAALFLDGRLALGEDGYHAPDGVTLPDDEIADFEFGPLSALPLFPVLARDEMRGYGGNELAALPADEPRAIWAAIMDRLARIPKYVRLFERAYPTQRFEEMTFGHAANAIAGFIASELALADTPWDRFLAGDAGALSPSQRLGAELFLNLACSECHSGPVLTDGEFHNVALAQIGPGLGNGPLGDDDYGRYRVTGDPSDRYAFRTPALRNVELTAPYGHAGQFLDLSDFIAHYGDSADGLRAYGDDLPQGLAPLQNFDAILETRDELLDGVKLTERDVTLLTQFMLALTDPAARDLSHLVPASVPSGLPVARVDVAGTFAGGP